MSTNETCPYCKAERSTRKLVESFFCGTTYYRKGDHIRGHDCYERQMERLSYIGLPNLCQCADNDGYKCHHDRCVLIQRNYLIRKVYSQAAEIERLTERNKILEETVRIACEEYPVC
jgi:hypothetical protein